VLLLLFVITVSFPGSLEQSSEHPIGQAIVAYAQHVLTNGIVKSEESKLADEPSVGKTKGCCSKGSCNDGKLKQQSIPFPVFDIPTSRKDNEDATIAKESKCADQHTSKSDKCCSKGSCDDKKAKLQQQSPVLDIPIFGADSSDSLTAPTSNDNGDASILKEESQFSDKPAVSKVKSSCCSKGSCSKDEKKPSSALPNAMNSSTTNSLPVLDIPTFNTDSHACLATATDVQIFPGRGLSGWVGRSFVAGMIYGLFCVCLFFVRFFLLLFFVRIFVLCYFTFGFEFEIALDSPYFDSWKWRLFRGP
jgi:hypothetical protein